MFNSLSAIWYSYPKQMAW